MAIVPRPRAAAIPRAPASTTPRPPAARKASADQRPRPSRRRGRSGAGRPSRRPPSPSRPRRCRGPGPPRRGGRARGRGGGSGARGRSRRPAAARRRRRKRRGASGVHARGIDYRPGRTALVGSELRRAGDERLVQTADIGAADGPDAGARPSASRSGPRGRGRARSRRAASRRRCTRGPGTVSPSRASGKAATACRSARRASPKSSLAWSHAAADVVGGPRPAELVGERLDVLALQPAARHVLVDRGVQQQLPDGRARRRSGARRPAGR